MDKIICDYYRGDDIGQANVKLAAQLANELGQIVDRYGSLTFFMAADALGMTDDRDERIDVVAAMAWYGFAAKSLHQGTRHSERAAQPS